MGQNGSNTATVTLLLIIIYLITGEVILFPQTMFK